MDASVALPPSPSLKLKDIHPDLIPFLSVPHNIPLVCFFDPNRYDFSSHLSQPGQNGSSGSEGPRYDDSTRENEPESEDDGDHDRHERGEDDEIDSDNLAAVEDLVGPGIMSPPSIPAMLEQPEASSSTGPYTFSRIGSNDGKRKKRRCLICMNAGRITHAYICPGRGNRSTCATAREIALSGGSLPPESAKWKSKNIPTPTPIFTPIPMPVFPFPQVHAVAPSIQMPPGVATAMPIGIMHPNGHFEPHPLSPPPTEHPPAPLGYLRNGAIRKRRPRRCRICNALGKDGTLCPGRAEMKKCSNYAEGIDVEALLKANPQHQENDGDDGLPNANSVTSD